MSFVASYARTMANARQVVMDEGVDFTPRPRRDRVIALSRRWQAAKETRRKTEEAFREAIQRAKQKHGKTRPFGQGHNTSPNTIISMVAAWHEVTVEDIMSRCRTHKVIDARHDAIAAVWLNCRIKGRGYTLPEMGRAFDGRDHSTIIHALEKRGLK